VKVTSWPETLAEVETWYSTLVAALTVCIKTGETVEMVGALAKVKVRVAVIAWSPAARADVVRLVLALPELVDVPRTFDPSRKVIVSLVGPPPGTYWATANA